MLQLNITLFVQALNFFIAYRLFSTLFLKPAFNALVMDDARLYDAQHKKKEYTQRIAARQQELADQRTLYEQSLVLGKPHVRDPLLKIDSVELPHRQVKLTEQEKQSLKVIFKNMLLQKVRT